ncbi:MAG: hypothetical protein IJ418_21990 [Clostridia bacterium]|nr:hypothetical protein [Clostridia bacterium]
MLTKEQRLALLKKKSSRDEIDTFYLLAAALSALMCAEKALQKRAKLIPGGGVTCGCLVNALRVLCCAC